MPQPSRITPPAAAAFVSTLDTNRMRPRRAFNAYQGGVVLCRHSSEAERRGIFYPWHIGDTLARKPAPSQQRGTCQWRWCKSTCLHHRRKAAHRPGAIETADARRAGDAQHITSFFICPRSVGRLLDLTIPLPVSHIPAAARHMGSLPLRHPSRRRPLWRRAVCLRVFVIPCVQCGHTPNS